MDKVLVVDDDQDFLSILEQGLRRYERQFEVLTASNGEEAIQGLRKQRISVLVTGLDMPRVEGIELLTYMFRYHPTTPCIVMTEHGARIKRGDDRGEILRYVEKPLDSHELALAIIDGLDRLDEGGFRVRARLRSLLQLIELAHRTCLLHVQCAGRGKGFFYFVEGALYSALCGDLRGEDAALRMMSWHPVDIRIKCFPKGNTGQRVNLIVRRHRDGHGPDR
jgi:CheY-like chemotaxis protein